MSAAATTVRGWWPVLAAAGLLLAVAAMAELATLDLAAVERAPLSRPAPPPPPDQVTVEPSAAGDSPAAGSRLLGQLLTGLLLLATAGLAGLAGWAGWALLRRRRRTGTGRRWHRLRALRPGAGNRGPVPPDGAALLAAVEAAVASADDDPDPRRAVIACWVRLEQAAAAAGTSRHGSDTATDLVVRLLREHQVSEPVLAALATAYRLARFATHTVDEPTRTRARSALRRLRAELSPEVAA